MNLSFMKCQDIVQVVLSLLSLVFEVFKIQHFGKIFPLLVYLFHRTSTNSYNPYNFCYVAGNYYQWQTQNNTWSVDHTFTAPSSPGMYYFSKKMSLTFVDPSKHSDQYFLIIIVPLQAILSAIRNVMFRQNKELMLPFVLLVTRTVTESMIVLTIALVSPIQIKKTLTMTLMEMLVQFLITNLMISLYHAFLIYQVLSLR